VSIKPKNAKKYCTALVAIGIDSVDRLLAAAGKRHKGVSDIISNEFDLADFEKAIAKNVGKEV
jgi:hypothetical protein